MSSKINLGRARKEISSDDDSVRSELQKTSIDKLNSNTLKRASTDGYESKKKTLKASALSNFSSAPILSSISAISATCPVTMRTNMAEYAYQLQKDPHRTIKRSLMKVGFYLWVFVVAISILNLMGVPISSSNSNDRSTRGLLTSDDGIKSSKIVESDESSGLLGSWQDMIPEAFNFFSDEEEDEADDNDKTKPNANDEEADTEIIPQQYLAAPKQGNKLNKKLEKELACQEDTCVNSCNDKIKAKCAKSASCRKDREKLCKRRCRKQRCEDRCKDEPKFGYVEREQRMEKCKDECTGPTAVHNKCIKKCHSQFKPCKSRCHEVASKYICDKLPEPLFLSKATDMENNDEEEDNDNDSEEEMEDEEEIEATSVQSILSKEKKIRRTVSTDDIEDDDEEGI